MNRIEEAFANKKAFIPFVTAGDPTLDTTREIILAMQEAGADLIEIGIPFSDPVAEGPVIQEADIRALSGGTTTDKIFDMVKGISDELRIPVAFMTYINPIYVYGVEKFAKRTKECGVAGVIVINSESFTVMPLARPHCTHDGCTSRSGVEMVTAAGKPVCPRKATT